MFARTRWSRSVALLTLTLAGCGDDPVSPPPPPPPPSPIASVQVSPAEDALLVGQTRQLTAIPRTAGGEILPAPAVGWSSNAAGVATVTAAGVITGLAEGTAIITATIGAKSGSAMITVLRPAPPPPTVARVDLDVTAIDMVEGSSHGFVATPRDPDGQPVTGLGMIWSSSHSDIVSVGPGHGLATALRPGTATITVRVHGKEASATVQVTSVLSHDLIFNMWADGPGQPPVLATLDPRDPLRTVRALAPGNVIGSGPTVSPDGRRIAFASYTWWGTINIHVLDRDTGEVTRLGHDGVLFDHGHEDSPAWSPDGQLIAFRRAEPGQGGRIWVMRPDGTERRMVTPGEPDVNFYHPTWSPGSNWIAYTRESFGIGHIWSIRVDGTGVRQHTSGEVSDMQPAWSPGGDWIAFVRAGLSANLRRVHVGTGSVSVLMGTPAPARAPAWSPDGSQIAFVARPAFGSAYEVFTVHVGEGPLRLAQRTADGTEKGFPAWLPRR